jgi:fluoroquinolone resistance protein
MTLVFDPLKKQYSGERFVGENLTSETIVGTEFESCVFEKCRFLECGFLQCKFIDCVFQDSMLSAVKLLGSTFLETVFRTSKIMGTDWSKTASIRALQFHQCDIHFCGFSALRLKHLVMKDCRALEVNFAGTDCGSADFEGTDFDRSIFQNTNLSSANFRRACRYAIDVRSNVIKKAIFSLPEASSLLLGLDIVLE